MRRIAEIHRPTLEERAAECEREQTLSCTVAYDGAPFAGFAKQPGQRTVQGELEEALALLFRRPVLTFIDTSGAYPGLEAEARGQGEAIARNLMEMSRLTVPVIAVITGEGNSGGALALGVADRVLMLENAVYAILSPEGFASILWKDAARHAEACDLMKLTAPDLLALGIVDDVVPEPEGGAHLAPELVFQELDRALSRHLAALLKESGGSLAEKRYQKFRKMGVPPKEES